MAIVAATCPVEFARAGDAGNAGVTLWPDTTHHDEVLLRRSNPLDSVSRLMRSLHSLNAAQERIRSRCAAAMGVTGAELSLILLLLDQSGTTPKNLSSQLGITTSAMTSMLDRLEFARIVTREANPHDRRSLVIQLTERGKRDIEDLCVQYFDALHIAGTRFPALASEELVAQLNEITRILGEVVDGAEGRTGR